MFYGDSPFYKKGISEYLLLNNIKNLNYSFPHVKIYNF